MKKITLWHNPRCSKSRQVLSHLNEAETDGLITLTVRMYLSQIPNTTELNEIFQMLNLKSPKEWMRQSEAVYKEKFIKDIKKKSELLKLMMEHPILIERPVVIDFKNKKVLIARPTEKVFEIIKN